SLLTAAFCASLLSSNPVLAAACNNPIGGEWVNYAGVNDNPGMIQVWCARNGYRVRVYNLQSNGQWYGRPVVPGTWDGFRIEFKEYAGAYQEIFNVRMNGNMLDVNIFNRSLSGSQPDYSDPVKHYWKQRDF